MCTGRHSTTGDCWLPAPGSCVQYIIYPPQPGHGHLDPPGHGGPAPASVGGEDGQPRRRHGEQQTCRRCLTRPRLFPIFTCGSVKDITSTQYCNWMKVLVDLCLLDACSGFQCQVSSTVLMLTKVSKSRPHQMSNIVYNVYRMLNI